jgi:hypothetical protein
MGGWKEDGSNSMGGLGRGKCEKRETNEYSMYSTDMCGSSLLVCVCIDGRKKLIALDSDAPSNLNWMNSNSGKADIDLY